MRTTDFETILAQSIQLIGMDRNNLSEETFEQIRDFANYRLKYAYEYDVWPELTRITKFPVTNAGNMHYIVLPENGVVTNTEGTFKTDVGTIFQVTVEDPRSKGKVREVGFSFDEYETEVSTGVFNTVKRLIVDIEGQSELYITYRLNCPELIGNMWKNQTYYPQQSVYWAYATDKYFAPTSGPSYAGKKGNFWKCVSNATTSPNIGNNNSPVANDKWEKVKIPAFLSQYIIKAVHSDWLRSELQVELAQVVEKEAQGLLDFEIQKCIVQQGIQPRMKFNKIY